MDSTTDSIFLFPNFIDQHEAESLILAMEKMMASPDLMKRKSYAYKRDTVPFGIDNLAYPSNTDLSIFPEYYTMILELSNKIIKQVKLSFSLKDSLYLSALYFSKQHPGSSIPEHEDTDSGTNYQTDYSGIVYLNTIKESGQIKFLDFDYSKFPEMGDLLIFDSKSTGLHEVLETLETRYTIPIWLTKNIEYSLF
jgi:hypothetical protein